jgi:hypothetical protein
LALHKRTVCCGFFFLVSVPLRLGFGPIGFGFGFGCGLLGQVGFGLCGQVKAGICRYFCGCAF